MARFSILLLPATLLGGCILYDDHARCQKGQCEEGEWTWEDTAGLEGDEDGDEDGNGDEDGDEDGDGDGDAEAGFTVTPNEANAGETVIVSVTATNFDLAGVTAVEAFGAAELLATQNRGTELLLTLAVSATAAEGDTVDLLLESGSEAEFLGDAVLIHTLDTSDDGDGSGDGGDGGDGGSDTGDDCE